MRVYGISEIFKKAIDFEVQRGRKMSEAEGKEEEISSEEVI